MIQVLNALYGCSRGGADVTSIVQELVNNGNDDITVTNETMGGDPCQGHFKFFAIKYKLDSGEELIRCIEENETIDLVEV